MGNYGDLCILEGHGVYFLEGETWRRYESGGSAPNDDGRRFLSLMVFDGAWADIHHRAAQGEPVRAAFVGQTPRSYFGDAREPSCTEWEPVAQDLATWAGNGVTAEQLRPFVAVDDAGAPASPVHETLQRLVAALGLPAIEW